MCNTRRAVVLLDGGKAEIVEHGAGEMRAPNRVFQRPSVIRMVYLIKRPRPKVRLTRREVFIRDRFTCQYCGIKARDLTIDHVVPRHRGGPHTWDNLVSACRSCNHRKGGKLLEESRLTLNQYPFEPKANSYYLFGQYLESYEEWTKFIPESEKLKAS
ncbi:MAG: HNH endonuclease [Chloroflexota bacterium]